MKKLAFLLTLCLLASMLAAPAALAEEATDVNFLLCWNGGGTVIPDDIAGCAVLNQVTQKTGVRLNIESIVTNETEKLNTMFASGMVPDLVNAAYWWSGAGEVLAMRSAIEEGLLYDLTDIINDYPNVKDLLTNGLSSSFREFDLNLPEYGGRVYFIPTETPSSDPVDMGNSLYGVYCRKDILEALGVDPASITDENKLYELACKIRDGSFVDATGKAVIPMSTWHNGWKLAEFTECMEDGYYLSNYRGLENGEVTHWAFLDVEREKIKYVRKLINEGLLDVECFSQTSTMAEEKYAIGKVAMFAARAQMDGLVNTLYKTNPEMEYTLLGPLVNRAGQMCTEVQQNGASGCPVLFLSAALSEEKARAILGMLDYINSEEGRLLMYYGIEGENWTWVDGLPTYTPETLAAIQESDTNKKNLGLKLVDRLIGAKTYLSKYPMNENDKSYYQKLEDSFAAKMPPVKYDMISSGYFERNYDKMNEFFDKTSTLDIDAEKQRAYFAATEEEAMKIWDNVLKQLTDAGVEGMCEAVKEGIKNYPEPDRLSF